MIFSGKIKDFAFSILDRSKQLGFHLFKDLKFYSTQFNLPAQTIFDVGANIGQTSVELRKYFPDAFIHAFEPIDTTFSLLEQNLGSDRAIRLNNIALGAETSTKNIKLAPNNCLNSLLNEIELESNAAANNLEYIQEIKISTGRDYCNFNQIEDVYLLKSDTEGYDLMVLQGFEKMLAAKKISFILVEVNFAERSSMQVKQSPFYDINDYLMTYGYNLVGFYDAIHHGGFEPNLSYCNFLYSLPFKVN
jgi:FkbM family methyltransferase